MIRNARAAQAGPSYMVKVNDAVLCMADRNGRVVGIDRRTGHELWRLLCPVERLTLMNLTDDALVLAGLTGTQTDAPSSTLMVLDPLTGEVRLPPMDDKRPILWASVSADGLLLSVTATEAVAHHLSDGNLAWRIALTGDIVTPIGPDGGELLFVQELFSQDSGAAGNNPAGDRHLDGAGGQPVGLPAHGGDGPAAGPRAVEQDWHLLRGDQAIALGADGLVRWRDAVAYLPDRQYQRQLIGEDRLAVLALIHPGVTGGLSQRFGVGIQPQFIVRGPDGRLHGNINVRIEERIVNGQRIRIEFPPNGW